MIKWHKYRDFKPSIKTVIDNKKNSHDKVRYRGAKTQNERLFLSLNSLSSDTLSGYDRLISYIDFTNTQKYIWIPLKIQDLDKSSKNIEIESMYKKLDELCSKLENEETLWIYIVRDTKILENDEIKNKAKVVDVFIGEKKTLSPDINYTADLDLEYMSNVWIKLDYIKKSAGLRISDLKIFDSDQLLIEVLHKSNDRFFIVKKSK